MVLKADQERVKTLLKDTITLLCRNGLTFKSKFSIEALIGVTLDDSDVFLVSINELIQTEKAHEEEQQPEKEAESQSGVDSPLAASEGSRERKRRRTHVKTEASQSGSEDNGDGDSVGSPPAEEPQSPSSEPTAKRQMDVTAMKQEVSEDNEDIVFIKEEPKETVWHEGQTESLFSDMTNAANSSVGNDQNFPSLADMNLVPVASQEENTLWASQTNQMMTHLQQRGYRPRGPRTSTVTMGSMGDGQLSSQSSQDMTQVVLETETGGRYTCGMCGRTFSYKWNFRRHYNSHLGRFRYPCHICPKGYSNRNTLASHMEKVHKVQPEIECLECYKVFNSWPLLKEHMQMVHPKQEISFDVSQKE